MKFIRLLNILLLFIVCLDAKPYRGGELRTIQDYRYGRFEVRMKSAAGDGVISSFFTYRDYWSEGLTGSQHWNEIDWEWLGRYDDRAQTNLITQNEWNHEQLVSVDFNPHDDYNTYAFEWTPDYVAFFVNDDLVRMDDSYYVDSLYHYQKIMMNIWQPTHVDWVGEFDPDILPVYAFYDWVKYYAYVPGTGNTGTDNNFIMLWEDEFNFWNMNRWEKATHTFDNNNVDFIEENVVFHDSNMILCMTTPSNTGYEPEGPEYTIQNPGFESNFEHWSVWPENLTNYAIVSNPTLHGNGSLKVFGQNSGVNNSIAIFQTFHPSAGEQFNFSGFGYVSNSDPIQDGSSTFLEITFFDSNWNVLGEQHQSSHITNTSPMSQWISLQTSGTAPNGVYAVNVAMVYKQVNDGSGSVFFDDLNLNNSELDIDYTVISKYDTNINAFPNPFNNHIDISFDSHGDKHETLIIVNILGQPVRTSWSSSFVEGNNNFLWDGKNDYGQDVPTGIYFVSLKSVSQTVTKKIMLLK